MLLILQLLKSSLSTELKRYHKTLFHSDLVVNWVSSSAFSQARTKIKYDFFIELNKFFLRFFYKSTGFQTWYHFRLLAVDGSELNLPPSQELKDKYGIHHTNSIGTEIPNARVSFLFDVKKHITLDAQIESFRISEQAMFEEHLLSIGKRDLLTADANYGHFRILKSVINRKADYCIRFSKSSAFVKDFIKSGEKDKVLIWYPSVRTQKNCKDNNVDSEPLKVRLLRIDLSDTITEILITSLIDDKKYNYDVIRDLYDQRWGAEEEIKKYMQRLLIEFFSSTKVNGVLQDFHANVFVLNLVGFLAEPIYQKIDKDDKENGRKYKYQTNWTSAISDIRERTILLFIREVAQVEAIIQSIQESFRKIIEPIRLGRKFPRDKRKKGSRQKAFMNYKPI